MTGAVVLKLGGELIETDERLMIVAKAIVRAAKNTRLVVVHGGGREIDAALAEVAIPKRQVDGLRVTDLATLRVVVGVLTDSINTRFVAAINAAGGRAVGLTGADAGVAPVRKARPHKATGGETVDLGWVGQPTNGPAPSLLPTLCRAGFVPIIACISAARNGQLFNVNADTLAGSLAARLKARRLVIAGGTAGVLDEKGQTVQTLDRRAMVRLVTSGIASAGMVAKLRACEAALKGGVRDVVIVDGRDARRLTTAVAGRATDAATRFTDAE